MLLARALVKSEQGLPLTAKEEDLIAELHRRKHENRRERMYVDGDGTVHIRKTIDAEPILQAVKAYGDFIDTHTQRHRAQRMIGAIDPLTAATWAKETGLRIGTKEFAKFASNRIKNDIDYRRFRVGGH